MPAEGIGGLTRAATLMLGRARRGSHVDSLGVLDTEYSGQALTCRCPEGVAGVESRWAVHR